MSVPSTVRRFRSGQVPLWVAIGLAGLLIVILVLWTLVETSGRASDGRREIIAWGLTYLGEDIHTLVHQFEKENPDYKVIISASAERDTTSDAQRLLSAVAGGVPPDVVFFNRSATGEWASRNALSDLTPLLESQSADDAYRIRLDELYPWALAEASYQAPGAAQASIFGIPLTADIRVLYLNAQALRDAGLVDANGNPLPPRTWEELREYAKKLTIYRTPGEQASGIARLGFAPGLAAGFGNSFLYLWGWQAGGSLLSPDGLRVTFDTPEIVRALRFLVDLHDDVGGAAQVAAFQQNTAGLEMDPFLRGAMAMRIDNDWFMRVMIALFKPDMDFIVAPAPLPADRFAAGEKPLTWAGGFSLVIPETSKNKQGAFRLIQYITSERGTRLLERGKRERAEAEGRLYLPEGLANRVVYEKLVQESVFDNPRMPQPFKHAYEVLRELMLTTRFRPVTPVGQLLWNQQRRAIEDAIRHRYDEDAKRLGLDPVQLALQRAAEPVQRQLDDVLRPPTGRVVRWWPWFVGYLILITALLLLIVIAGRNRRAYRKSEVAAAMMFASPWIIGMILLVGGPIVFSIVLAFTRYDVLSPARYTGLENFRDLLADPIFYKSIANTAFMLIRVPLGMLVGLGIAMLLDRAIRGIGFYRTAMFMPAIVPMVAASLLWMWIFNPTIGPINGVLGAIRLPQPLWLSDPNWSKPALIIMSLWTAGASMIIWLAGLQSIPPQLYEAASIDGAGPWRRFWNITIPMLSPYILFNAIVGVIATMQIFGEAYIMTPDGRPADSTMVYAYHLFKQAFQYFRMGYASALAWILFVMVLALTILQLWAGRKWVHYERT